MLLKLWGGRVAWKPGGLSMIATDVLDNNNDDDAAR